MSGHRFCAEVIHLPYASDFVGSEFNHSRAQGICTSALPRHLNYYSHIDSRLGLNPSTPRFFVDRHFIKSIQDYELPVQDS
jgi:hypothetical protein